METLIAQMLNRFESGKMTRRQLIGTLTLAATTLGVGSEVALVGQAQGRTPAAKTPAQNAKTAELLAAMKASPLKAIEMTHVRYTTKDYKATRDFYAEVMGMLPVPGSDDGSSVKMAFFPKGENPKAHAKGTPSAFMLIRNGWTAPPPAPDAPAGGGGGGGRAAGLDIDHVAFTVEFDKPLKNGKVEWEVGSQRGKDCQIDQGGALEMVRNILTERGLKPSQDHDTSFHVNDLNNYNLQISGIGMDGYTA
jgi:catechol 2,3-dioxygenase-like lactoylglutathione lyase family enzyme